MSSEAPQRRTIGLLGDPVAHSLSPVMQNAGFEAAGVPGVYVALRCGESDLAGLLGGLARSGGGGNITLPHKEAAARIVDVPSEAVRRTGACNTFWSADGRVHGDNTDVEGFRRALQGLVSKPPEEMSVLLLGAGGAARAVLTGLLEEGVPQVSLLNRSVDRARAVARRIGGNRVHVVVVPTEVAGKDYDLVVNCTSLGLKPDDALPVDLRALRSVGALMDLIYGAQSSRLLQLAADLGIPGQDGRQMLLHQGAAAFERWWPGVNVPLAEMAAALSEAVER